MTYLTIIHNAKNHNAERWLECLFWLGIALGLGVGFWYQINQIVDGDQLQMIHRGYQAAYLGLWPATGNAASVVGNVPGFLSTAVVAGPLMLWDSPYAPIVLLLILRLAGFLMIDAVVRQALPQSMAVRIVLLLLLWLNPWVQYDSLLYNPSYLIFCSGLHLYTAWHLRDRPGFWVTFWHVLAIGFAMQLHFSWPLLAFISVYLWWRQIMRVNWWGVAIAVLLIGISLVPYLSELLVNPDIARNSDPEARERYIGWGAVHVYPVLKSVIYWLRYGAWAFPSKLVNDAGFDWVMSLHWLEWGLVWVWRIGQYFLAAVTVVIALVANIMAWSEIRHHWRRRDGAVSDPVTWLLLYALGAFVAMLLSAGLAPIVFNYWHLVLILPAAVLPVLVWVFRALFEGVTVSAKPLLVMLVAAVLLIATNLVALHDSRKFSWSVSYADQVRQYVEQTIRATRR